YIAYSTDINNLTSVSDQFDDFCKSQVSNILVYNALENAETCTIQSDAAENKKNVTIILHDACKWFKSDKQTSALNLKNNKTLSSLSFDITNEGNELPNLATLSDGDLMILRNSFNEDIKSTEEMQSFEIVKINNKRYIYFKARSKGNNVFVIRDTYIYEHNKLFILIRSAVGAMDE